MLDTYLNQLKRTAEKFEVDLLTAFQHAGVDRSTYYRTRHGQMWLSEPVAVKVMAAIYQLKSEDQHADKG